MKPQEPLWLDVRHIVTLAAPLVLTQLAQVAVSTTDIVMMGMLGPREIAAGGLAVALFNQLRTMGAGLVTGTANLVASANARGDHARVLQLVRASFGLSTFISIVFMILMVAVERPLVWLGQDADVARQAAFYLAAVAPGMMPCLWFQSLRQYTVGLRKPGPLLAITVVSILVNAMLDYALMFGRFGLPSLGLTGIAYATSMVYLFSFLAFLAVTTHQTALRQHLSLTFWRTDAHVFRETIIMGAPIAATYGSEAAFFTVLSLMIGTLGADALAAHTVVSQVIYIVFMISVGLSHALSVSVTHACAQRDYRRARRIGYTGLALGSCVMLIIAFPYLAIPGRVLAPFLTQASVNNADMMRLATGLLTIAALTQFFDCGQNIGVGLLRGLGDVRSAFWISLVGYWMMGMPIAWAAAMLFGRGVYGAWIGLSAGLAATAVMLLAGFKWRLALLEKQDGIMRL
ncbi:MATE family efflux transporter [Burkholderia gladioli]|uniref:Multidrug-efflux transporter n=1 Tax=Burkholderia gladioli (strain BSR3) TaxID=999541 RepID=F2LRM4_BURGS|nr:MATE family efflux transporter [Burkholderia gladioli]AEA65518.1 efflux protein [Burkholderia gladioli BSR3]